MKNILTALAAVTISSLFAMALIHCIIEEERIAAAKVEALRAEREQIVNIWRVSK